MFASVLQTLAQSYSYDYTTPTTSSGGMNWFSNPFALLVGLVVVVSMWFVFKKAKKPGWAAIIPIYNTLVLLEIIKRPWWWILLMFIPIVNIVVYFIVAFDLAKAFGKGGGMALLLIFLPFIGYPILGFGDAKYKK
jgi:hypothetical protein